VLSESETLVSHPEFPDGNYLVEKKGAKEMRGAMVMGIVGILALAALVTEVRSEDTWTKLTVIEDAAKGETAVVDLGQKGDSPGDITTWHEPLMDTAKKNIGTSNGFCIRTVSGQVSQCQWTLTMPEGTITLASTELEKGTSPATIAGGTGAYCGVTGEADVTHNTDGTYTINLKMKKKKVKKAD
jgi:hypothetical protein